MKEEIRVSDVLSKISKVSIRAAKEYTEAEDKEMLQAGKISVRLLKRTCSALSINSFQKSNYGLLAKLQEMAPTVLALIADKEMTDDIVTKGKGLKSKTVLAANAKIDIPESLSQKLEKKAKALAAIEAEKKAKA